MSFNWLAPLGIEMLSGDGQRPTPAFFENGKSLWQGTFLHENPRLYKYRWTVFRPENAFVSSPIHHSDADAVNSYGWDEFWGMPCDVVRRNTPPKLSIAAAMWRIRELHNAGITMLIRNERVRRLGDATPWNDHKVSIGAHAPAYEDDLDPSWHGHK